MPWRGSFGRILTMQLEPPKIPLLFALQIIHRPMHPSPLHTSEANNEPFTFCDVFLGHLPINNLCIRVYIIVLFIHCQFVVH